MAFNQIIIFKVQNSLLGLDIRDVNEIIRYQPPSEVPDVPDYWEGIINLRSSVIAIANLAKRLKLSCSEVNDHTKIIVVKLSSGQSLGLVVDEVVGIYNAKEEEIEEVPKYLKGNSSGCYKCVLKNENRLVIVLDYTNILSEKEHKKIKEIAA